MFKFVCECQTTEEREVNLHCNENANCLSCANLCCQSASPCSIAFQPLIKRPTINPDVAGTNHSTEPFPSFITDKSISFIVMFFPRVSSLFFHRFLSFLDPSELFCLYPSCRRFASIPSRGRFSHLYNKSQWNERR